MEEDLLLADVAEKAERSREADALAEQARVERDAAIRDAVRAGRTMTETARVAGLSREMVSQVVRWPRPQEPTT